MSDIFLLEIFLYVNYFKFESLKLKKYMFENNSLKNFNHFYELLTFNQLQIHISLHKYSDFYKNQIFTHSLHSSLQF